MSDEDWTPNMKRRLIWKKSARKRRKLSSIRQQHNLSANRARDLDEDKRRREARQLNPERRAAAHRARDLDEEKRRRDTENQRLVRQRNLIYSHFLPKFGLWNLMKKKKSFIETTKTWSTRRNLKKNMSFLMLKTIYCKPVNHIMSSHCVGFANFSFYRW